MKRPPYGSRFQPVPRSGVRVVIGQDPDIWDWAARHYYPIMVLPQDQEPQAFKWPSDGNPALIYERGELDDKRLDALAHELLKAGASSVVALREALIESDPRVFYDKEVIHVAA